MRNTTEQHEKLKPYQLRKEVKRLTESRDNVKTKNRIKAQSIKDHKDRLREISESRDKWKKRVKEEKQNTKRLDNMLQRRDEMLAKSQAEHDQLLKENQELKSKFYHQT